ncbi:ATPase AAA [Alkalihalobacillus alcalophilus ATCC 27647 = CGMCC 1.3604]|uniref:ATPase AAA n=1 Tax=Alkalihalobacillus alcalophilus ATCC 27647 = CGMCC 1.3604 TaxID=1218173 RepID=A0A094WFF4_ALKAL|nr:AAA family ATPase [Alkalihalobacillus alcalophilus]KGA95496.1 ATPase AAA [Alkalihalobacillus alcalophilus ATCC 27647 = CGMCC 1.3604]MED1563800.1 AAA family ATPase [Alkalihalobacillus alcalophilus]THG91662.1 ATPase AAA [Alkalihalobacillus alcalophilus ATCC 27647 = CGMCC 1.3604]
MIHTHFQWNYTPFQKDIKTEHLFMSARFQEVQARLMFMIQQRSFGLITGDVGAGKSTAIRALKDRLASDKHVFLYVSDSSLKPRDFYREMLLQVNIEPEFLANDLKRQFKKALLDIYENQKKTPVVVIDEAHLLSPSMLQEIRFLTNFNVDSLSPLALILVGQPELRDKLRLRSLEAISQRINTRFHLDGLTYEELAAYIIHQLKMAGEEKQIFTEAALKKIYKETRGTLRLTNRLCTECLLDAVSRKQELVDEDSVQRVLDDYDY